MLNKQHIQQLKQTNISVNGEATKRHMEKVWKSSSIQQKQAVKALAGISAQTIYRVYNTGSISAKIAIAAAQVLNVNPFYLTGVVSAPGECTGEALRDLLMQNGYRKLLAEIELAEKKVKRAKKAEEEGAAAAKAAEAAEAPPAAAAEPAEAAAEEAPAEEAIAALAAEDLQALLSALFIRAGAGVAKAQETLKEVQSLLLA